MGLQSRHALLIDCLKGGSRGGRTRNVGLGRYAHCIGSAASGYCKYARGSLRDLKAWLCSSGPSGAEWAYLARMSALNQP